MAALDLGIQMILKLVTVSFGINVDYDQEREQVTFERHTGSLIDNCVKQDNPWSQRPIMRNERKAIYVPSR